MKKLLCTVATLALFVSLAPLGHASSCSTKSKDGTQSCSITCPTGESASCESRESDAICKCE